VSDDFFKGLNDWQEITEQELVNSYVVYGGDENIHYKIGRQ
jgi:hypothetical protein